MEATRVRAEVAGVTVRVTGDLDAPVRADPRALSGAVTNLLSNAAAFAPPGSEVLVRVHAGRHRVRIAVTDHGIGIAPADQERVFERFYRSREARMLPGSGLGLAIVAQAAGRHGGAVTARRAPSGGALMTLTIPGKPPSQVPDDS